MGVYHGGERLGNGGAVLHLIPEGLLILIVAGEGNGLGIAVNDARAGGKQSGTGGAVARLLHAFADSHPNEAVGKGSGDVVLNVAAVDERRGAGAYRPTVAVVGGGDAGIGGEAEVGGISVLSAVGVIDYDALVKVVLSDGGAGSGGAGKQRYGAAGGVRDGLSFILILVGEVGILAVIGADEQNVDSLGPVAGRLGGEGLNLALHGAVEPAGSIVIHAVHAVNGEGELLRTHQLKAAPVDKGIVHGRVVSRHCDFGSACPAGDGLLLNTLDGRPCVVEHTELLCFSGGRRGGLCHRAHGQQSKRHENGEHDSKELLGQFHLIYLH